MNVWRLAARIFFFIFFGSLHLLRYRYYYVMSSCVIFPNMYSSATYYHFWEGKWNWNDFVPSWMNVRAPVIIPLATKCKSHFQWKIDFVLFLVNVAAIALAAEAAKPPRKHKKIRQLTLAVCIVCYAIYPEQSHNSSVLPRPAHWPKQI